MSYVIYHVETTKLLRTPSGGVGCFRETWESRSAALAALTRALKKGKLTEKEVSEYRVNTETEFRKIEKTHLVRNLMTGEMVKQGVNTPRCCDVSSELYWSM